MGAQPGERAGPEPAIPTRVKRPSRTSGAAPGGSRSFKLLQLYLGSDSDSGRQVEVRGFLIRVPNDDRINVTSMRKIADSCAD